MRVVGSRPADCHSMASANEPRIRWLRAEGPRGTGGWPLAAGASLAERFGGILMAEVSRMRRRSTEAGARTVRAARALWPDHNPLRRSLDRVEAAIVAGLVVALLAGAPMVAVAAGDLAYNAASRTASAQRSWHQARAVLLASASVPGQFGTTVRAQWVGPAGERRTGLVPVLADAKAGSTVMVWVDGSGQLTGLPLQRFQVQAQAVVAALLAPVMLGLLLGVVGLLAHGELGRRRMAAWDADWQATEPQWTRRH